MIVANRAAAVLAFLTLTIGVSRAEETLREAADANGLRVGAMFLDGTWKVLQQQALVVRQFNCLTLNIYATRNRPARGRFSWNVTEESARWAERYGLPLIAHNLLFARDQHTPKWMLDTPAREARAMLEEHITGCVNKYRGRVKAWVVVNEAVSPHGGYRDTYWLRSIGPDYVNLAHRLTRRLDPDAVLVYNDHDIELSNSYQTRKWRTAQKILRKLVAERTVDALGWQMHTTVDEVLSNQLVIDQRMRWVHEELGLMNFVTELDITVEPTDSLERQAEAYRRVVEIWRRHAHGGWLQTWGIYDGQTHLGPETRPLLFDARWRPKPAYEAVRSELAKP